MINTSTIEKPTDFITPAEHTKLIGGAGAALIGLCEGDDFQGTMRTTKLRANGRPRSDFSLHFSFPGNTDSHSLYTADAAKKVHGYNFIVKDADTLGGAYDNYNQVHLVMVDNRYARPVPVAAISPLLPTPAPQRPGELLLPHALEAVEGDPWRRNLRECIEKTVVAEPEPHPLTNLLAKATLERTSDISLVSIMPSHRGKLGITHEASVLELLYNGCLRLAETIGHTRMVAALDRPVLLGLRRPLPYWHALHDVPFLPYETRVKNSNKSTVATVDLLAWRQAMIKQEPAAARKRWGQHLEDKVEIVGINRNDLWHLDKLQMH